MPSQNLFLIDNIEGVSPEISKLLSMMNYTRETTLAEVRDLSVEQMDFLIHEEANSIGMLLAHMAAVEQVYQIDTFEKRELTESEIKMLELPLNLGEAAQRQIKNKPIEHYLEELKQTRKKTIETFQTLQDDWLFEQTPFWAGQPTNNYFKWFHVFEDELNHRGQIRIIKKLIDSAAL